MKISKAMKKIARLKGKISDISSRMISCVSTINENEFTEDFNKLYNERKKLTEELIELKNKVMKANIEHGAFITILELAEHKSEIEFLRTLNIKQGTVSKTFSNEAMVYKTQLTVEEKNKRIDELQEKIDELTDRLDEFNAITNI